MQLGRAVRIFFLHQILQVNTAMPPPFQELRAITNFGQFTSQTSSTTADKSCPPTSTPSALTEKSKTFLRERFFAFARSSRKAVRPEDPAPTLTIFTKGEWPMMIVLETLGIIVYKFRSLLRSPITNFGGPCQHVCVLVYGIKRHRAATQNDKIARIFTSTASRSPVITACGRL